MLGNILRLIRIANDNKNIKDIAKEIGITPNYLCDLEKGNKRVSLKILKKIALFYDMPLSQIFLFDELQNQNNLNNQQILKMILEYYSSKEKENNKLDDSDCIKHI